METLTQRLRRELETCPLPLNAVAREAEILQPVLWRFVKGDGGISLQTADKLCDFFDVFPDDEQSKLESVAFTYIRGEWPDSYRDRETEQALKATLATKAMAFMQKEAAKEVSKIMKRKRAKQK